MQWPKHLLPFGIHYLKSLRAYSGQWSSRDALSIHNSQSMIYPSFSSTHYFTFQTHLHIFQHTFLPTRISKTQKIPYSNLVTKRALNFHTYYSTVVNFFIFLLSIISIQINSTHWLLISSSLLWKVHTDRWSSCNICRIHTLLFPSPLLRGPTLINEIRVLLPSILNPHYSHSLLWIHISCNS